MDNTRLLWRQFASQITPDPLFGTRLADQTRLHSVFGLVVAEGALCSALGQGLCHQEAGRLFGRARRVQDYCNIVVMETK